MAERGFELSFDRAIRMICVIALVLLALAHRPAVPSTPQLSPQEIAALTLPDGSLPELCLPTEDGKAKGHTASSDCEACRIAASALLPAPADAVGIRMPLIAAVTLPQPAEAHYRQLFPPDSHPRAPPITA